MICQRCRPRGSRIARQRFFSTSPSSWLDTLTSPRGPASGSHEGPPAATSTSAAQPFSTPLATSPAPTQASQNPVAPIITSSVPAGTPLRGLGYFKGKDPPIAKEDHEYPPWLWRLLDEKNQSASEEAKGAGDLYCMSRKSRSSHQLARALLPKHRGEVVLY